MALDSSLMAAGLLLGTALFAGRPGAGNYLRFAAMLCAALAAARLGQDAAPGLAAAAALIALPLTGAALALCALARTGRKLPALPATLFLAGALGAGLGALFTATVMAALLPLACGGIIMAFTGWQRRVLALSGVLVLGAACAGAAEGLGAASLSLLAAGLFGAAIQKRVSSRRADFSAATP